MSVAASVSELRQTVSSRWQMPLLLVSLVLLGVAFFKVQPPEKPPTFQQLLDQIEALQQGRFLTDASEMIQGLLLSEAITKEQRAILLRELGETVYLSEQDRVQHDPENTKGIVRNHRRALAEGAQATPEMHEQMGQALQWLGSPNAAIDEYRKAIALGSPNTGKLRRQIIEILRASGTSDPSAIRSEIEAMLADEAIEVEDLLWAVEERVALLSEANQLEDIEALLAKVSPRLEQAGYGEQLEYLRAEMHYLAGDHVEAERLLLGLRAKLDAHDRLASKVSYLLGRIHYADGRPQEALAVFKELRQAEPSGEYHLAAELGVAESLAALHHIDESAEIYERVAGVAAAYGKGKVVDRDAVRESLNSLATVLRNEGRLAAAVRFLRLATALVPEGQDQLEAKYLQRLAALYVAVGEERLADAERTADDLTWRPPTTQPEDRTSGKAGAREMFAKAGDTYLRLSRVMLLDPDRSADATWHAGVMYDRANMPERAIAVFEDFVLAHPQSSRVPDVLYRLGRQLEALKRYDEAIAVYEDLQKRFARTPPAMSSMVPMARCYMAKGVESYPQAEKALLVVVEQPTDRGRYSPEALEYREALFALVDLYDRWGRSVDAISRLEEILERYPNDKRITRTQFMLANSYRKNALDLLSAKAKPVQKSGVDAKRLGLMRLRRAETLFSEVIYALKQKQADKRTPMEQRILKYSHLYRADCAFDLGEYDRALTLYEDAARHFRRDPIMLPAYVQILNCCQRLGKREQAQATLQRVKWLMKGIPEEAFGKTPGRLGLDYWKQYFDWLEQSDLFKS